MTSVSYDILAEIQVIK